MYGVEVIYFPKRDRETVLVAENVELFHSLFRTPNQVNI